MRVRQWVKQGLIVLPLIAVDHNIQFVAVGKLLIIAFAFSLVASAIYIFNDLQDLASDRLDIVKSNRPIAAGLISKKKAGAAAVLLLTMGFLIMFQTVKQSETPVYILTCIYLFANLLYSKFHLKKIRMVGLTIVCLGFPIRFSIGTTVLELPFSTWAFTLTLQLSMFMLSGKRFQSVSRRPTSEDRDSELQFWLLSMVIFGAFFAATYSGFITDPEQSVFWGEEALIISTLPLGLGLARFVELVIHSHQDMQHEVTERMTSDYLLLAIVIIFVIILFIGRIYA